MRAWQSETLRRLLSVSGVQPALLIVDPRETHQPKGGTRARLGRLLRSDTTLWDLYNNGYVSRRARALSRVDCSDLLDGVARIEAVPELHGRFSEHFPAEVNEAVRLHDLDFILRFAYGIIRGDVLNTARYGVWSFHHGDEQVFRGGPPAFWEMAAHSRVSGVLLQRLTDRLDGGIVLRKGWFATAHHSYVANTDRVHLGGVDFPAQVCRDVLQGSSDYLHAAPSSTDAPIYLKPSDRMVASFAAKSAASLLYHQVSSVALSDKWNIGLVREPITRFVDPDFRPTVEWFGDERGRDRYLADPFPLRAEGPLEVLAEDFDYSRRLGTIAQVSFEDVSTTPIDRISRDHASYPYSFGAGGVDYVTMQVAGQRDVHLMRVEDDGLRPAGRLGIDEEALDPTLVEHDGRWWIFFTRPGAQSLTELYVWSASELFGSWTPHARNPVKTDVRSARPAGTPFRSNGQLYRPAQDCSVSYGGGISIARVDCLTPDQFEESVIRLLEPDPSWPYPRGIHTLAAAGDVTLIDAKRQVFNRHESLAELRARLTKAWRAAARR